MIIIFNFYCKNNIAYFLDFKMKIVKIHKVIPEDEIYFMSIILFYFLINKNKKLHKTTGFEPKDVRYFLIGKEN